MSEQSLFWADQIARKIHTRKKMKYVNEHVPKLSTFTVKTSASLSGVLHIGRLSDTIRGEAVYRGLKDLGLKAQLIWVAEDMDPLRKVPKGVPASFKEYLGMPVTDLPDPEGCHESYAKHHVSFYFEVLDEFVQTKMTKYSMREEYKKGTFKPYIKKILSDVKNVVAIQNKYRSKPLPNSWSPWTPLCDNCRKIITPRIEKFEDGTVFYTCKDYAFEKTVAQGCGHEGENDPLKGHGKLLWKSEWASQWAHWRVVSEGAGKEYQVPLSAWWVNAEIVERVFHFPMPEPIFYEHIMINGEKMSASLGNIIYPKDWLDVASPELLRFFYYKKLMKTRSFSWTSLPALYDEYTKAQEVFFGHTKLSNKKEEDNIKRLFELSQLQKPNESFFLPFEYMVMVSQVLPDFEKALDVFKSTGHIKTLNAKQKKQLEKLFSYALYWGAHYAPEHLRIVVQTKIDSHIKKSLSTGQQKAIKEFSIELSTIKTADDYHKVFKELSQKNGIRPKEFFEAMYLVLLGKKQGPRLAPFLMSLGKKKVEILLKQI